MIALSWVEQKKLTLRARRFFMFLSVFAGCVTFVSRSAYADLSDDLEEIDHPSPTPTPPPTTTDPASSSKIKAKNPKKTTGAKPNAKTPESAASAHESPPGSQPQPAPQPSPKSSSSAKSREPVYFESQGVQGQKSQGQMQFLKDVVITQADLKLESDKATIFYDPVTSEVLRVAAVGNVRIQKKDEDTRQNIRAQSNEAVFYNGERKVVLKGNARLWRGQDLVKGKEITYELDSGWIKADRVEGVVQPSETQPQKAAEQKASEKKANPSPQLTPSVDLPKNSEQK